MVFCYALLLVTLTSKRVRFLLHPTFHTSNCASILPLLHNLLNNDLDVVLVDTSHGWGSLNTGFDASLHGLDQGLKLASRVGTQAATASTAGAALAVMVHAKVAQVLAAVLAAAAKLAVFHVLLNGIDVFVLVHFLGHAASGSVGGSLGGVGSWLLGWNG